MHTPTSKQAYFVAQVFREAIERYPGLRLDMAEVKVNMFHACGTVHCHGGTYAIMRCDLNTNLNYVDGADQMAVDLGFNDSGELDKWVYNNPSTWGNSNGDLMFSSTKAFCSPSRPDGALSIQHIAQHWKEVAQRLEAIEEKLKPINMEYTVSYFIEKFEAIPEEKWITHWQQNAKGQRCAYGHCMPLSELKNGNMNGFGHHTGEGEALGNLFPGNVTNINNGGDRRYQQPTPKQRILAALYDIKKMQEKPANPAPCTDTIVGSFIPVSYTKMELVGAN